MVSFSCLFPKHAQITELILTTIGWLTQFRCIAVTPKGIYLYFTHLQFDFHHCNTIVTMNADEVLAKILEVDRKFRRARRQVIILHNRFGDLCSRRRRSTRPGFRYSLYLQGSTTYGVLMMFKEYAERLLLQMDQLQEQYRHLTGSEYQDFEAFDWKIISTHHLALFRATKPSQKSKPCEHFCWQTFNQKKNLTTTSNSVEWLIPFTQTVSGLVGS